MGNCISFPFEGRTSQRFFQVWNVDEVGNKLNQGKMEITDTHLVFHQKGRESIQWPLRGLRRYGCDAELFSFESGRRCPTGSGVYAFQCNRAQDLFNLLQERLQQQQQVQQQHHSPSEAVQGIPLQSLSNGNLLGNTTMSMDAQGYLEPILMPKPNSVSYVNDPPHQVNDVVSPSASLLFPDAFNNNNSNSVLLNGTTNLTTKTRNHVYMNVDTSAANNNNGTVISPQSVSPPVTPISETGINYVVLDLDNNGEGNNSVPLTPTTPPGGANTTTGGNNNTTAANTGYATIDFDKTAALLQSSQVLHLAPVPLDDVLATRKQHRQVLHAT